MKYKRLYLKLSDQETEDAISRFHFEDNKDLVYRLLGRLELWIRPECFYLYEKMEGNCHETVTALVTLGKTYDQYHQRFQEQEHFLEAHALDCLSLALLSQSYEKIKECIHREKRQFVSDMFFPDESQIPDIISRFQAEENSFPIQMNAAGALIPSKTVVFQGKLSSYHDGASHSCESCDNTVCPFRRIS